jgi:hypothetical protein
MQLSWPRSLLLMQCHVTSPLAGLFADALRMSPSRGASLQSFLDTRFRYGTSPKLRWNRRQSCSWSSFQDRQPLGSLLLIRRVLFPFGTGSRSRLAHARSPSRRARLPGWRGAYPQHAPMAAPPPCSLLTGTPRAHAICARLRRRGTVPVIHSSRGNSPSPSLSPIFRSRTRVPATERWRFVPGWIADRSTWIGTRTSTGTFVWGAGDCFSDEGDGIRTNSGLSEFLFLQKHELA